METIDRIQYDEKGDVLYLYFRDPETVEGMVSEEVSEGVLVDRDRETGETVGYTIIDFVGRKDADEWVNLENLGAGKVKA